MLHPRIALGVRWDGRGRAGVLAAGLIVSLLCALLLASAADARMRWVSVVVAGKGSERAVDAVGGHVTRRVRLIDGVVARVPAGRVGAVRRARGVRGAALDRPFGTRSEEGAGDTTPDAVTTLDEVRQTIGADALPADGAGVDVAMVDSGITPVARLGNAVVDGPDFSPDAADPDLRHLDAFGHGTHLAGIVGAVAPGARLVNVKAANAEGVTSLGQLLAAIDWVVAHRRADGLNIRVLTLAVGADNVDGYEHEPLAWAVEQAWRAGVVVVAAAGNDGDSGMGLEIPAADPFVIAAGGAETQGTGDPLDDTVADWSSRGDGVRNPDVIAPGSSIVSLRVPGSYVDLDGAGGRVGEDLQRGSGTSQAAAATAGALALLIEDHPGWSADQVKAALREGARPLAGDPRAIGAGALDVAAADAAHPADAAQRFRKARFAGRGLMRALPAGAGHIRLEESAGGRWTGRRWTGVKWNGVKWAGVKW